MDLVVCIHTPAWNRIDGEAGENTPDNGRNARHNKKQTEASVQSTHRIPFRSVELVITSGVRIFGRKGYCVEYGYS